jgi:hypothetical protein
VVGRTACLDKAADVGSARVVRWFFFANTHSHKNRTQNSCDVKLVHAILQILDYTVTTILLKLVGIIHSAY